MVLGGPRCSVRGGTGRWGLVHAFRRGEGSGSRGFELAERWAMILIDAEWAWRARSRVRGTGRRGFVDEIAVGVGDDPR